jgi:hypothetical protein
LSAQPTTDVRDLPLDGLLERVRESSGLRARSASRARLAMSGMMSAHTVFDVDLVAEQTGRALLESDAALFKR